MKYMLLLVRDDAEWEALGDTVAGFGIVDVAGRDEAIEIAKRWPGKFHKVEVRPMAE